MTHNSITDMFGISKGDLEHEYSYLLVDKENNEIGCLFLYQDRVILRSGDVLINKQQRRLYI